MREVRPRRRHMGNVGLGHSLRRGKNERRLNLNVHHNRKDYPSLSMVSESPCPPGPLGQELEHQQSGECIFCILKLTLHILHIVHIFFGILCILHAHTVVSHTSFIISEEK